MNNADWADCAVTLEAFPGDFPPRTAEAYRRMLDGLSKDEVLDALQRYVRKGERWRPAPGEIVALAGRSTALPPFGALRQALTLACRTTAVRLARTDVDEAICAQVEEPLVQQFVHLVGGERIRRAALYEPEDRVERVWESLARDYVALTVRLQDEMWHSALGTTEDRPKLPR